jgi:hypothetical protein
MNNEVEIIVTSKDKTDAGFNSAKKKAEGLSGVLSRIGQGIASLFSKGVSAAVEAGMDLFQTFFKNTANGAATMATNVATSIAGAVTSGTALTASTGGLNIVLGILATVALAAAAAIGALTVGMIALAPVMLVAGGVIGAAVTGAIGLGAAFAVLKMGTHGIADAMEEFNKEGKISEETMAKLSPNAQKLVGVLTGLKAPLDEIRRFVQDKLLENMDTAFGNLATKWLPTLKPLLGDLATTFNQIGKSILESLASPTFIANIQTATESFGKFFSSIGEQIPGLIEALGNLAAASAPFLEKVGELLGRIIEKFADWINKAAESGELKSFMEKAAETLQKIYDVTGKVIEIFGLLVAALFPQSAEAGDTFLDKTNAGLDKIKAWLQDPQNIEKIQKIASATLKIADAVYVAADAFITGTSKINRALEDAGAFVGRFIGIVLSIPGRIGGAFGGMFDGIKYAFKSAVNWVVERWNNFSIPGVSTPFGTMGGFNTPNIGYMASGGIGSGMKVVGERGREIVDLGSTGRVYNNGQTEQMLAGGGSNGISELLVTVDDSNVNEVIKALIKMLNFRIRTGDTLLSGSR